MKKVFIVYGSEDGLIGAYSNIKKAYESAAEYIKDYSESAYISSYPKNRKNTYGNAAKELSRHSNFAVCEIVTEYPTVTITKVILNR